MPSTSDSSTPPDLHLRYLVQVCFPEPREEEEWETINSFATPMEALRGCSQSYDIVCDLLDLPFCQDMELGFVKIRILDAEEQRVILWENETGGLVEKAEAFRPDNG